MDSQQTVRSEGRQGSSASGRWEWDVRSNRVSWDDGLLAIYGLDREEFVPTFEAYLLRVHPGDRDHVADTIDSAFKTRSPFSFQERIVRPSGEVRVLRSRGEVVTDERGEVGRMVGVCEDVTDLRTDL